VWRYGDIKVEAVVHDHFTDLALAVVEEAHIRAFPERSLESNRSAALGESGFRKYWESLTPAERAMHRPCR
jgi:hypothetical protein